MKKTVSLFLCFALVFNQTGFASEVMTGANEVIRESFSEDSSGTEESSEEGAVSSEQLIPDGSEEAGNGDHGSSEAGKDGDSSGMGNVEDAGEDSESTEGGKTPTNPDDAAGAGGNSEGDNSNNGENGSGDGDESEGTDLGSGSGDTGSSLTDGGQAPTPDMNKGEGEGSVSGEDGNDGDNGTESFPTVNPVVPSIPGSGGGTQFLPSIKDDLFGGIFGDIIDGLLSPGAGDSGAGATDEVTEGVLPVEPEDMSMMFAVGDIVFPTLEESLPEGYICLDLYHGNIVINASSYSGYDFNGEPVSGKHNDDNQYYIYQSNGTGSSEVLSLYNRVGAPGGTEDKNDDGEVSWADHIIDNSDVGDVVDAWEDEAEFIGRTSTEHYINITGSGSYDVTIDNLWSTYCLAASSSRQVGSFGFNPGANGDCTVHIKGDNRFANIHYDTYGMYNPEYESAANGQTRSECSFTFDNGEDDGALDGTLTVASFNGTSNHYQSVIGGSDSYDKAVGFIFNSGIIYAGAHNQTGLGSTKNDSCSAIGGGGNGIGVVEINGGIITAVTQSSGAAIGGGIGESSLGGKGIVTITDGEVYAYNFGFTSVLGGKGAFIPAAAIGSGSSHNDGIQAADVSISGGKVYAQSVGGAAIGGGSSSGKAGGDAVVKISGGDTEVIAKSIPGADYNGKKVDAGVSIGGGTAGPNGSASHNGGNAEVIISGGTIETGSIGGGGCANGKGHIGGADVTISGGEITGQVVMAQTSAADCSFSMTGGVIDNGDTEGDFIFLEPNGGAVYVENGIATMDDGVIQNCSGEYGGAVYVSGGDFIMTGGNIEHSEAANGGAVYVNGGDFTMTGGTIDENTATNGGAVYIDGGDFIMTSGHVTNNVAKEYGGAVYASGGSILIGVQGCTGDNDMHDSCPQVLYNESPVGGGFYVGGDGSIIMYCGRMVNNVAENEGLGDNLYMDGGTFDYNGGSIGMTENPGAVVVGGVLNDNRTSDTEKIEYPMVYHANFAGVAPEEANKSATAALGSYLNLPDGSKYWDRSGEEPPYHFVGWTLSPITGDVYIRDANDFKALGVAVPIHEAVDGCIDFYALWAPGTSQIRYMDGMTNADLSDLGNPTSYSYSNRTNESTEVHLNSPEKPGFVFKGWRVVAMPNQNSNWGSDAVIGPDTGETDYSNCMFYEVDNPAKGYDLQAGRKFGDIILIAEFEEAFQGLKIEQSGISYADIGQSFLYRISGRPYNESIVFEDMIVAISGNDDVVIKGLPVGVYTITPIDEWSWRYILDDNTGTPDGGIILGQANDESVITFEYTKTIFSWLNGFAREVGFF